ncbi:MAG: isocitrate lyase/phosphoenolpyruvate mutase family protein [Bacteroidota bacterium]
MKQQEKANIFRGLHKEAPLVLPNIWDVISARMVEKAGASALATTSAGISWSLGLPDGGHLTREVLCDVLRNIVRVTNLPVSADIERGYGAETPEDVAQTVRMVLDAGVVGINLEDAKGPGGTMLRNPDAQADRIARARSAATAMGCDLFINARTDVYMVDSGLSAEEKVEAVAMRAALYADAGADGMFVPGVTDIDTVRQLAAQVAIPLNIMAMSGAPAHATLAAVGAARISTGPALALGFAGYLQARTEQMLQTGTLPEAEIDPTFLEMNTVH